MYKVLLVDDEPFILEGLPTIIDWEEHNLEIAGTASNGQEAIDIINSTNINILITDIRMPRMDGLELIHNIKANGKNIKVIILSGYDDFKYVKEAAKLGIENYLLKPIDDKELTHTLVDTVSKIDNELYREVIFREERNVLRENILNMWVTGSISDSDLKEKSDLLNIPIQEQGFIVSILKIVNTSLVEDKLKNDHNQLRFAVQNICNEIIAAKFGLVNFYNLYGELVLIFTGEDCQRRRSEIETTLYECIAKINTLLKVNVFISAGGFEKDFRTLYQSHSQAKKTQEFSLILGHNKVMSFCDLPESVPLKNIDLQAHILNINSSVKNRDINKVLESIDDIFNQLENLKSITPSFIQNIIIEVLFAVIKTARSLNTVNDSVFSNTSALLSKVYELTTLEETKRWLNSLVTISMENFVDKQEKKSPIIIKVLNYINSNYTNNINLKTVAAEFNLNSFYVGQLFKKETGKTFTDYVNNIRIDKAKELLLNQDLKTSEIASIVGYANTNYFYTIFKKINGMSPAEFRGE